MPSLLGEVGFFFFLRVLLLFLRLSKRVKLSCSTKSNVFCDVLLFTSIKFSGFSPRLFMLIISKALRDVIVTALAMKFLSVE